MSRQQEVDELFDVKNYFYIGNFQQCINETQKLQKSSSPEVNIMKDVFTYRSYLAQKKYLVVLDEIKANAPAEIKPLKLLAEYFSSVQKREGILAYLDQQLVGTANVPTDTFILVAATIYANENNWEAAYRILHNSECLEAYAFVINILLKLDRLDLAKKKLKEMQDKDDDATLTQLAQAWVNTAIGGEKLQDAYYIYQELVDKYGATPHLLNSQAVTFLGRAQYEEAETVLQEALDKDSNCCDTLINMIVLHRHSGKSTEVANRYLSQLKTLDPEHPYIKDLNRKEEEFFRISQQYSPSNPEMPALDMLYV